MKLVSRLALAAIVGVGSIAAGIGPISAQVHRPQAQKAPAKSVHRGAPQRPRAAVYVPPPPVIDVAEGYVAPAQLPTVLGGSDVALYRRIFTAQAGGDWRYADADISQLRDKLLLGYVGAQRFLSAGYTATYDELAAWLRDHNDLPDAPAIYRLAQARRGGGGEALTPSSFVTRASYSPTFAAARTYSDGGAAASLRGQLERMIADGGYNAARSLLDRSDTAAILGPAEVEQYRGRIATRMLADRERGSIALPIDSVEDSAPRAAWRAGIAAWRKGDYGSAAARFAAVADAPADRASSWTLAAGAFWAARAHAQAGQPERFVPWMKRAALHGRTFYGLLALRTLGVDPAVDWRQPELDRDMLDRLRADRAGKRAIALLQLGQATAAGRELYAASVDADPRLIAAVLALAGEAKLPMLSLRVANAAWDERHRIAGFDAGNYPTVPWKPQEGWIVDRALVLAFMRQESAFDPKARSRVGAMGLMQLMPGTAAYVVRTRLPGQAGNNYYDPEFNLSLGQQYLAHLLENEAAGDLVRLAASYNGGTGNVSRWDANGANGQDPLLWIASIPLDETRDFVERILCNYWLYRLRFGQKNPSLDQLAANQWPRYEAQDGRR